MTEQKELRYEPPPKPAIEDVFEIRPDTTDFGEGEKAWALAKFLGLKIGDTIRENDDYFIVNPRMKLRGHTPEQYKTEVNHLKALCTPKMIAEMTEAIKRKTKTDKFYDRFTKRLDKRAEFFEKQIAIADTKELLRRIKNPNAAAHEAVKYFNQQKYCAVPGETVAGMHNCVYWLLNKDDAKRSNSGVNEFVLAWFDKPIPNSQEWREESDGEYRVLTDSEADQACDDYLDDSRDIWVEAVKADQTDQGFEDWKEMVRDNDGRGNCLNHYDGAEEYEDINGTTYYIYRTN